MQGFWMENGMAQDMRGISNLCEHDPSAKALAIYATCKASLTAYDSAVAQDAPDTPTPDWREGEPPHPWNKEWFIAITIYGDRVVLRALPEEYAYDYTTADGTYIKAEKIKKWMQFPDSEFKPFQHLQDTRVEELERDALAKRIDAMATAYENPPANCGANPIGPLFAAGCNECVKHVAKELRALLKVE